MRTPFNALLIALCCATIFLTGCKASSPDTNLIGNNNCNPPCWNEITPGQTNKDQATMAMHQINYEKGGELSVSDYGISWQERTFGRVYAIEFEGNLVKLIRFPTERTSLEQILSLFGEPDYLITEPGKGKGGGNFILIYYPNKGLAFTIDLKSQKTVTADGSVVGSWFLPPTDIRNAIGIIHGEEWIDEFMARIHNWNGYGEVTP